MAELSHEEALKHVLHDEIVERLDKIIALLMLKFGLPPPQYMITNIEFVVKNGRRSGLMTLHVKLRNHNA